MNVHCHRRRSGKPQHCRRQREVSQEMQLVLPLVLTPDNNGINIVIHFRSDSGNTYDKPAITNPNYCLDQNL